MTRTEGRPDLQPWVMCHFCDDPAEYRRHYADRGQVPVCAAHRWYPGPVTTRLAFPSATAHTKQTPPLPPAPRAEGS